MPITISDEKVWDTLVEIRDGVKENAKCIKEHEDRIKKLERTKKANGAWDWTKKGSIGALVTGIVTGVYLLLQYFGVIK